MTSREQCRSWVLVLNNRSKQFALSPNTNFPGNCLGKSGNLVEHWFVRKVCYDSLRRVSLSRVAYELEVQSIRVVALEVGTGPPVSWQQTWLSKRRYLCSRGSCATYWAANKAAPTPEAAQGCSQHCRLLHSLIPPEEQKPNASSLKEQ